MNKRMVEITAEVKAITDMAILINDGTEDVWLPKSQLEDWPDIHETGEVILPEWLAEDKCLL